MANDLSRASALAARACDDQESLLESQLPRAATLRAGLA
jgi:hypothetical protein